MKKIAISQSNYIPWKGYFDMINMVDTFVIYDEVQYTKNDWRNRNILKTKKGLEWITISVKQNNLHQTIDETEVFLQKWNRKHWGTLQAIYGKSPFFKQYKERFENLYLGIDTHLLSEINKKFILEICDILEIKTQIINSRELFLKGDANERLIDACEKLEATTYVSGPAAKAYIDEHLFRKSAISIEWIDYSGYKEYKQMWEPFEHGVSVLDLIFNKGDEAKTFLKTFNS
ncbi:WbqC family protein [uncultured Aquimarina sp.]|uniref:WbqC family protein n=1 Tax=uncultured Aquimarina sp. TaxID=575652 RepID=UPI0026038193|nr:WbqC family protein [uncultured Aquimarina sp.]